MKRCKECNKECKDGAKFCGGCGAQFPEDLPDKKPKTVKPAVKKPTAKETKKPASGKASNKKPEPKKATTEKRKQKTVAIKKPASRLKRSNIQNKFKKFNERKMAIYEMTPQDNCGECGCKNCMMFAMQAASENNSMELGDCPYIDAD